MAKSRRPEGERSAKIGPYEVIKRIGAGGMGTVYLAKDNDLGRMVALKVLPPALAAKADMIGRFRQEAQHAAKLRHENIVTLYGCGDHKGIHYLAMEFVDGCNLLQHIKKQGKLDAEEARILTVQATKALVCAHEQNIVHRDIKPSNFLLAIHHSGPVVKLTDFGLARTVDDFDGQMTRTGTTVGTVDYISPEQARNSRAADIRSDIYSLGCTLYHMLAGRPPFPDGDLAERLMKHIETEPPDILQFNPQTPAGLVQILWKMLAKKPDARYQNPSELLRDLANPPKGPAISPREALELLALASGEKARPTRLSSMQETQRQIKVKTAPLPANLPPAVVDMKLHYRKEKNERSPRSDKAHSAAEGPTVPFALEGLGPWLGLIGGITAVAIIAMAILFKWGGKSDTPKAEDDQTAAESREQTLEKKDTKDQSKKIVPDSKYKIGNK
ncbi:MAG TPA: serine/threonine-protein kinase [Gemmataceae bacterium]|nr:serine/threonine-protein kinase [Gemmataceae bacterium]